MPPERFDWSDRQQPQAGPAPAGLASAGLAEAAPSQGTPAGSSAPPDLVVRTRRSDHQLQAGTVYTIGRDPKSDIVMTDSRVSWRHGVLRVEGRSWVLEDLGSTNGTFREAQRTERVDIAGDCVIHLGNPDDGPVLRCIPQAPQVSQAPPVAPGPPPAAPPGTALSDPPGSWGPSAPPVPDSAPGQDPAWWQPPADPSAGRVPQPPVGMPQPGMPQPGPYDPTPREAIQPDSALAREHGRHARGPEAPADPWGGGQWPSADPGTGRSPIDPRGMGAAASESMILRHQPPAPADSGQSGLLPSVDRRPTSRMPLPAKAMRIGRIPDNDLVLSDLDVSRHHAELRRSATGGYEIVDLGSHNGTYVNGQRVTTKTLTEEDLVSIGHSTFRLKDGELVQFVDDGEVSFSAQDLVVRVGNGKILLDHVTFPIPERCLLGVIGPSGAGKSTLLGALTGMRPADTGTVLYDNRDLYRDYAELRYRIGLVPQESVLHTQLTARRALQYSAELRFPADTKASERDVRVDEVMSELGLTKHANTRADRLSGGQLKRVNVAQELLTKPSLLFLDEPTSGLDPGLDKSVMEQMRDLAHDGRTVIVVTHSVANLDNCDRLLVLVPGGRIAFYGPPDDGLRYFKLPGWAEVFQAFERYPDRDWAAEFAASPVYQQYVLDQQPRPNLPGGTPAVTEPAVQRRGGFAQMTTLTRRYLRVIAADRGYIIFMALLPIVLGLLIHFVGGKEGLAGIPHTNQSAEEVLLMLVICTCLAGAASSVRELVKERSIFARERAAGLSSGAYLFSKLIVLGVISIIQSVVLVLLGVVGPPLPPRGAFLTGLPLIELLIGIAVLGLASMCLGLLVSALVSTSEKAMPVLVLLTMVQVILSGGVISLVGKTGLTQLAYISPSRWGFGAVASTTNLNLINPGQGNFVDPLWAPTSGNWLKDMGITIGLAAIFTFIAWLRLLRLGPRRRKS